MLEKSLMQHLKGLIFIFTAKNILKGFPAVFFT